METYKTILTYEDGHIEKIQILPSDIDEKNNIEKLGVRVSDMSKILLQGSGKLFLLQPGKDGIYILKPIRSEKHIYKDEIIEKPVLIGKGTYGEVSILPENVVEKKSILGEMLSRDIVMEIGIYNLLKGIDCLPQLYGFRFDHNFKFYLEKGVGTIDKVLDDKNRELVWKIIFRLSNCMRSISGQGVIHLDLKPQNIILDRENRVQIIDWGLAEIDTRRYDFREKYFVKQTRWYRSPEVVARVPYGTKADTYSMGLIYLEMLQHKVPVLKGYTDEYQAYLILLFSGYSDFRSKIEGKKIRYYEKNKELTPDELYDRYLDIFHDCNEPRKREIEIFMSTHLNIKDPEILDFLSGMLEFKPEFRSSWNDIITHPVFKKFPKSDIPQYNMLINNMPIIKNITSIWTEKSLNRKNTFELLYNIAVKLNICKEALETGFQLLDICVLYSLSSQDILLTACACLFLGINIYNSDRESGKVETVLVESLNFKFKGIKIYLEKIKIFEKLSGNIIIPTYTSYTHFLDKNSTLSLVNYLRDDIYEKPFITQLTGETDRVDFWSL